MINFRIFVSYCRDDKELAEKLTNFLRDEMEFSPLWDANIRPGIEFNEKIKQFISHSHIAMPLFTKNSRKSPWVQQETVYALALGIPVIPLAIDTDLDAFLSFLQYIELKEDFSDLEDKIKKINFERIILNPAMKQHSIIKIADLPNERTELMAKYANSVIEEFGEFGYIRQRGAFSTFSIPNKNVKHSIWKKYEGNRHGGENDHILKLNEREVLEKHARERGLSLIIDPTLDLKERGDEAVKTRLIILLEFLESIPKEKLKIVISERGRQGNLTIVGDWFFADSISPGFRGFRQTVFSRHAPSVFQTILLFDKEFKELLEGIKLDASESRENALEIIKKRIKSISRRPRALIKRFLSGG